MLNSAHTKGKAALTLVGTTANPTNFKQNKIMGLPSNFSNPQFLFTGSRFSGLSLGKTVWNWEIKKTDSAIDFKVILSMEIDYIEINESVRYFHHAEISFLLNERARLTVPFLKHISIQLGDELVRRYHNSEVFKKMELSRADNISDVNIEDSLRRILSDNLD